MIGILLVSLIILFLVFFIVFKGDILTPSILVVVPFIFGTMSLYIFQELWDLTITPLTYWVIIVSINFVFIGDVLVRSLNINVSDSKGLNVSGIGIPSKKTIYLHILYLFIVLILYFLHVFTTSRQYVGGSVKLLTAYRIYDPPINPILYFAIIISLPIAYYYLYLLIYNHINSNITIKKLSIPIIIYILIISLSSGRIDYLYLIISAVIMYYILYKKKHPNKGAISIKMIKNVIGAIFIFFLGFYLLGTLTGKNEDFEFFEAIAFYSGSSIAGLDNFLKGHRYDISNFGSETLIGMYNLFTRIGIEIENSGRILEFSNIGNMPYRTNIYTAYRRVINDYGYIGLIILQISFGAIYSLIYKKAKFNKNGMFNIILYAYASRYLIFQVVDERILVNMLSITTILQLLIIISLSKIKLFDPNKPRV